MKHRCFILALLSGGLLSFHSVSAITADELAQFLGIQSWSTRFSLPPGSFSAELMEIKDGAVFDRLLMPTAEDHGESDRLHILIGPSLSGSMQGNYRVSIVVGTRGIFSATTTRIPLFDLTRSNSLPEEIGEGDFVLLGKTRKPFEGANNVSSYARGFLLRIKQLDVPSAEATDKSASLADDVLAAARAHDGPAIAKLILQSFEQRGSLDKDAVKAMLDGLVRRGELQAFTVLLAEMRKTNYGKDWQPDDALLKELVRNGRRDFIDLMLASWLDPARLEAARAAGDAEMRKWITQRAAEVRKQRADVDALVAAAGKGDLETMRRLLDAGVDVNGVAEESRHTPLTLAAREDRVEAVRLLLERGAEVDKPKHPGWNYTPLCLAKSVEVAELLKAHGANVHAKLFKRDVSILTYQARFGGPEIVQWMLDQGLDPKMIGDNNQNLLFDAGDARTAQILLEAGVDPNHVDEFGQTPLDNAQNGEIAKLLIAAGAKPRADEKTIARMIYNHASATAIEEVIKAAGKLDPAVAQDALICAAHIDQAEIAELMLRHGAKANELGRWGTKERGHEILPLMVCTIHGSPKTARVLLAHGADPNAGDKPGLLLQNAIRNREIEVAKILRDAGAKGVSDLAFYLAIKDREKIATLIEKAPPFEDDPQFWGHALPTAARYGNVEVVRAAIEHDVPVTSQAFEAAASEGQHEVLAVLLAHRKKPHDPGELRQALWNAVWNSHPYEDQRPAEHFEKCVELLLDAGAPVTDTDPRQSLIVTAVFTRYPGGNPKVVEILVAAGADPNPILDKEKKQRLSDAIQLACDQQGCSTPFAKTLDAFERLANVKIRRDRRF